MASNYTTNYGLCQWEPGDSFMRTEFNGDNEKIDGAIHSADAKGARALEKLVSLDYNVCNLILQNYYEKKYTGYQKGLIFDGFLDRSMLQGGDEWMVAGGGSLTLSRADIQSAKVPNGAGWTFSSGPATESAPMTAFNNAALIGIGLKWRAASAADAGEKLVRFNFYVNGIYHHFERLTLSFTTEQQEGVLDLRNRLPVKGNDEITFTCVDLSGQCPFAVVTGTQKIYADFCFQSLPAERGSVTSKAFPAPACGGLLAWVRHTTGTVGLAVEQSRALTDLEIVGTASVTEMHTNRPCTETTFRLDCPLPAGDLAFRLSAELGETGTMHIYDYGVILL